MFKDVGCFKESDGEKPMEIQKTFLENFFPFWNKELFFVEKKIAAKVKPNLPTCAH